MRVGLRTIRRVPGQASWFGAFLGSISSALAPDKTMASSGRHKFLAALGREFALPARSDHFGDLIEHRWVEQVSGLAVPDLVGDDALDGFEFRKDSRGFTEDRQAGAVVRADEAVASFDSIQPRLLGAAGVETGRWVKRNAPLSGDSGHVNGTDAQNVILETEK
jgi:hypothetical protein